MPTEYNYSSRHSGSDRNSRPALRSRTQTFVDLSSRFSALPVTSSSFSSSTIYKKEDAGRVTTAYAITVTAINNGKDGFPRKSEEKAVTYITDTGIAAAAAVRVVNIKKPYAVDKPLPLPPVETTINAGQGLRKRRNHISTQAKKVPSVPKYSRVSNMPANNNIIEQAGRLDIVDIDGNKFPFQNLYSSSSEFGFTEKEKHKKIMAIFIRPSFCCRQQLRRAFIKDFLSSLDSKTALPPNTKLVVIWCGSHIRLRRLIQSTQCPYPIYADPNGLVYQLLEKSCETTHMKPNSAVSRHTPESATTTLGNLVQSARLIKEANPLKHSGARTEIGTAFLLESGKTFTMSWSHRIASVSARSEADVIRRVLGLRGCTEEEEMKSLASAKETKYLIRENTLESERPNPHQRKLYSMCGLPAVRYAHRRTVSCAEGFQTLRPRISCLAC